MKVYLVFITLVRFLMAMTEKESKSSVKTKMNTEMKMNMMMRTENSLRKMS